MNDPETKPNGLTWGKRDIFVPFQSKLPGGVTDMKEFFDQHQEWQYGFLIFQERDTKKDNFLPKINIPKGNYFQLF